MAVSSGDIVFTLSGGVSNIDPSLSLGGEPSSQIVSGSSVFNNISSEDAKSGLIDYRCIYVANNNPSDSLQNTQVSIAVSTEGGSEVSLGVSETTDVQRIAVSDSDPVTGGSFTISYEGNNIVVNYDSDTSQWATNLEDGLNGLELLSGVVVTVSVSNSETYTVTFTVTFAGDDDSRNHDLVELVSNDITGNSPEINISKIAEGSPINSEAQEIPFDTTNPFGVTFQTTPIDLGVMRALDVIPIWIRRETLADTQAISDDGITLRVSGNPF